MEGKQIVGKQLLESWKGNQLLIRFMKKGNP